MSQEPGESYYRENYADYERQTPANKLHFYTELVRKHVSPGSELFELGVGLGHFLERASREYSCSGCEINAFGLSQTQAKVPGAKLMLGSFETLPANSADCVVSWDVLEHIPDLKTAIATVWERLRPGGKLIGVVPVYDGPLGWLVHLLDRDPTHLTKTSRHAWIEMLQERGFEIIESGGILRKLVGSHYIHITQPQAVLRRAGTALYFVARKKA